MLLLKILNGKSAGQEILASRFPFTVGRNRSCDWSSEDGGVWETHARLELSSDRNFVVQAVGDATLILNGQAVKSAALRNGDSIALGSLELTCWLSPARHRSLALSESMTWTIILSVLMGQVAMIYWLLNRS